MLPPSFDRVDTAVERGGGTVSRTDESLIRGSRKEPKNVEGENVESGCGCLVAFENDHVGSDVAIADDKYGLTKVMSRELGIKDGR